MKKEKRVKDCWWEGRDLHVITEDDKHTVYHNAYFTSSHSTLKSDDTVEITTFVVDTASLKQLGLNAVDLTKQRGDDV